MGKSFLLCLVLVSISAFMEKAGADAGEDYRLQINEKIKTLASGLANIYDQSPPCVQNLSCSSCSFDMCRPVPSENTGCFKTRSNLYGCNCPNLSLLKDRSSTSYVRLADDGLPTNVQRQSICRTASLDTTFQDLQEITTLYTEFYVGLVDGTRRSYPGREEGGNCSVYDSRERPWYREGTSYPSQLVVLVDTGSNMDKNLDIFQKKQKLKFAKVLISRLVEVLHDHVVKVVAFGPGSRNTILPVVNATTLEGLVVGSTPSNASDLEVGLSLALSAAIDNSDVKKLRNILLITDGVFVPLDDPSPSIDRVVSILNSNSGGNVSFFVCGLNPLEAENALRSLASEAQQGTYIDIKDSEEMDLLYEMRSYFGYLAASHLHLYNEDPSWTEPYKDYHGLGFIVTVSYPVITSTKEFVGVAAIDVAREELSKDTVDSFRQSVLAVLARHGRLKASINSSNPVVPIPKELADPKCKVDPSKALCNVADPVRRYNVSHCCGCHGQGPAPAPTPSPAPLPPPPRESESGGGGGRAGTGVVVGSAVGAAVVALVLAGALLMWWRRRVRSPTPPASAFASPHPHHPYNDPL